MHPLLVSGCCACYSLRRAETTVFPVIAIRSCVRALGVTEASRDWRYTKISWGGGQALCGPHFIADATARHRRQGDASNGVLRQSAPLGGYRSALLRHGPPIVAYPSLTVE